MKQARSCILCIVCICFMLSAGCTAEKSSTDKLKDLEFTVLEETKVPEELMTKIREKKEAPFKITYADQGYLYIAQGYGARETSGYSIEVDSCYETANAVYIHTNLIGPAKEEQVSQSVTYPYVVVKLEWIEKHVVFE